MCHDQLVRTAPTPQNGSIILPLYSSSTVLILNGFSVKANECKCAVVSFCIYIGEAVVMVPTVGKGVQI